ncbi:MAG: SH3 domain-containing protein [Anaerolineae bacterium]
MFLILILGLLAAMPLAAQTATPTPGCPGLLPTRLIVHERGRVSRSDPAPVNVRAEPGTAGELIGQIPAGFIFYVLEGPDCTQRYTWYRVKVTLEGTGLAGWVAEGDTSSYFLERFPPGM